MIARQSKLFGGGRRFYVVDSDNSIQRLLWTEYRDVTDIVEVHQVFHWEDYARTTDAILKRVTPDDFLVMDTADNPWGAVQGSTIAKVYGEDAADHLLRIYAEEDDRKAAMEREGKENIWNVINAQYFRWWLPIINTLPCHLFCTAAPKVISKQERDQALKRLYPLGIRADGQKALSHQMHTVLWFNGHAGNWTFSTIKDRGRAIIEDRPVQNFAVDYLMAVAGWMPG